LPVYHSKLEVAEKKRKDRLDFKTALRILFGFFAKDITRCSQRFSLWEDSLMMQMKATPVADIMMIIRTIAISPVWGDVFD